MQSQIEITNDGVNKNGGKICGGMKGKRGQKTKIDIKNMTLGELRRYERHLILM